MHQRVILVWTKVYIVAGNPSFHGYACETSLYLNLHILMSDLKTTATSTSCKKTPVFQLAASMLTTT